MNSKFRGRVLFKNWFFQKNGSYDVTVSYQLNSGSSQNPFARDYFSTFHLPDKIN